MRLAAAGLFALLAGAAWAQEGELQPWQMVRSLQLVQDRLADGDHAALPMQRKLLEMIDARLRRADPAEFEEAHNFTSLLVYAMSGGNPATMRLISGRLTVDDERRQLSDGITHYVSGEIAEARKSFDAIDPMKFPAGLGSFLALVKGTVNASEAPEIAMASFDQARLLGPGTLVEEAALRRLIALHAEGGDARRFEKAAMQYVRRFLRSPYATQFAEAYVAGLARLHDRIDLSAVEDTVAYMNDEQAKAIYLRLARRGAVEGHADLLAFASKKAMKWADPAQEADPRAQLYASIGSITSDNVDKVLAALKAIDHSRLSREDRELLVAAQSIAERVTALPAGMTPPPARPKTVAETSLPAPAIPVAEPVDSGPVAGLLSDGRARIDAIDRMLEEARQ
jgi:chemotaxis protein MotC